MQIKGRIYILLRLLWGSERNSQLQKKSMQYTTRTNYWLPTQICFHNVIALKQNSKKHERLFLGRRIVPNDVFLKFIFAFFDPIYFLNVSADCSTGGRF
jgi:hypothetical protein